MKLTQELINVLQGIHDGKPWEYRYHDGLPWEDAHDDLRAIAFQLPGLGYEIRLKPEPEPEPDPYAEAKAAWLDGELQYLTARDTWVNLSSHHTPSFDNPPSRYRRKPKPVRVPLGPEDVPPGSVIKSTEVIQAQILRAKKESVYILGQNGTPYEVEFEELKDDWQINRSLPLTGKWDAAAWEPCWKEVQP